MAKKTVICIEFSLPGEDYEYAEFQSTHSLLEADIAIIRPDISDFVRYDSDHFQGKRSLSEYYSFKLKDSIAHWRREVLDALTAGKTIFIILTPIHEVYVKTGQKNVSGTGRNARVTNIVDLLSNYAFLPVEAAPIAARGNRMKFSADGDYIKPFWEELGKYSSYELYFDSKIGKPFLISADGKRAFGLSVTLPNRSGHLVLLPNFDFDQEDLITEPSSKDDEREWNTKAVKLGKKFLQHIVEIDSFLRTTSEMTPPPTWVSLDQYQLPLEELLLQEITQAEQQILQLQRQRETSEAKLREEQLLKALLYEKGRGLEAAIIRALKILGFVAAPFRNSQSEFDAVFTSPEGRFLGEAEGKDNKPINIDKFRQLGSNIDEDLARDEVTEPAKGVLFGNGHRLKPVNDRPDTFTEKCISSAKQKRFALVSTPDLFLACLQMLKNPDDSFASQCRKTILDAEGVVTFPKVAQDFQHETKPTLTIKQGGPAPNGSDAPYALKGRAHGE